jgi:hypothetical protein
MDFLFIGFLIRSGVKEDISMKFKMGLILYVAFMTAFASAADSLQAELDAKRRRRPYVNRKY